jgi:outer membrane receptor for ferrienterochelin and colicin
MFFGLFAYILQAKEVTLNGIVLDGTTKEALPGANITVRPGNSTGTTTDLNGKFTLTADENMKHISVSYMGYLAKTVKIDSGVNFYEIYLEPDVLSLNQIVVTGQGSGISKRRISSNVTGVSAEAISKLPSGRLDEMLQTALPNVQINIASGQPGSTSIVKSRGFSSAYTNSTPLIYVDGIRVDNLNTKAQLTPSLQSQTAASGAIGDISMENIERIEYVTGGAATTLFGSDAANGVIQIFTKKGGEGRRGAYAEITMGADVPTSRFYHFKRTKELLQEDGFIQKYRFGFDGGDKNFGYSFAAMASGSDGTIIEKRNFDKKYDISAGFRAKLNKYTEYTNSFGFVSDDYNRSRNGNQGGYTGLWFTEGGASSTIKWNNGQTASNDIDNLDDATYAVLKDFVRGAERLQDADVSIRRFQTSHSITLTPVENLNIKATLGVDYRASTDATYTTNEYLIWTKAQTEGTVDKGTISKYDRNYFGLSGELNASLKSKIGREISLITTAGTQYFANNDHQIAYAASNVRDGSRIVTGAGTTTSGEYLAFLNSYGVFLQENIGIKDKIFIDLGLRSDYNTAFGSNVKWQSYPKIGISYALTDEEIFRPIVNSGILNSVKLRANYGVAGSYPPPFSYQKTVNIGSYLGGQTATTGNYGNPDLGPEKKHSYEAGAEFQLLNSRLAFNITYYYALTKDALFSVPLAPSTGYATVLANVGEIENKGTEIFVNIIPVKTKFTVLSFNFSHNTNKNKVLSTGGAAAFSIGGMSSRTLQNVVEEGQPVGFLRGSQAILNSDGTLKEVKTLQNLGKTIPDGFGNFAVNFSYRNLSINLNGDYQYGAYVHSFDRQFRFNYGLTEPAIPDAALTGYANRSAATWDFTNFFVEKSDYVKIRTIGASYKIASKKYFKYVELSFRANNPFVITNCSIDPEAVLSGAQYQGGVAAGGFNYSQYSSPRQFIGSVKFTF